MKIIIIICSFLHLHPVAVLLLKSVRMGFIIIYYYNSQHIMQGNTNQQQAQNASFRMINITFERPIFPIVKGFIVSFSSVNVRI